MTTQAQNSKPSPAVAPPPTAPPQLGAGAEAAKAIVAAQAERAKDATLEIAVTGEVVHVGFDTVQGFNALQRISRLFSASSLVPDIYKGNVANCSIAMEMAFRMKASPLMVMQNLYIVHGNPSWSSKFLIASFNQCGRFHAIHYRWVGEKSKPSWGCQAYAKEKSTGEIVEGPVVTWQMAKSEGWVDKKGSKWLTIPDLMFMYRSATFLVRTTAPELTMGLQTVEEMEDIGDVPYEVAAPRGVAGLKSLLTAEAASAEPPHDPLTGEVKPDENSGAPSAEEQAEIAAREAQEAAQPK